MPNGDTITVTEGTRQTFTLRPSFVVPPFEVDDTPLSGTSSYLERARQLLEQQYAEQQASEQLQTPNPSEEMKASVKTLMKKRHLTKPERDQLHKPESDWVNTPRGEVCRNACTIEVADIIKKVSKSV